GMLYAPLWLAWCHLFEGNLDACRRTSDDALVLAERTGHPYLFCTAPAFGAALSRDMGDLDAVRDVSTRSLALPAENGFRFQHGVARCGLGWWEMKTGAIEAGIPRIQSGLGLLGAIGSLVNRSYFQSYLVEAYLLTGRLDEGLAAVDEALV